jgi:glycerophosphoryl diester phosphodiesterase
MHSQPCVAAAKSRLGVNGVITDVPDLTRELLS